MSGSSLLSLWTDDGSNLNPKSSSRGVSMTRAVLPAKVAEIITPTERIVDGDFADWSIPQQAVGWSLTGDGDWYNVRKSTDSYAGTYAMEIVSAQDNPFLVNTGTPATEGQTIQARYYSKRTSGANSPVIIYVANDGEDSYYYNFTGDDAGTWTVAEEGPTEDQMEAIANTTSYVQYTSTQATVPAESGLTAYIGIAGGPANGSSILVDNFEMLVNSVDTAIGGNMEEWITVETPDEWVLYDFFSGFNLLSSSQYAKSTDSQTGTYALEITGATDSLPVIASDAETMGASAGETIQLSAYIKSSDGASVGVAYLYELGEDMYIYNFDTTSWDSFTGAITSDNYTSQVGTGTYAQFTGETITIPNVDGGEEGLGVFVVIAGNGETVLIDNVTLAVDSTPTAFDNQDFESWGGEIYPDDWTYSIADDDDGNGIGRSEDSQAGDYAMTLTCGTGKTGSGGTYAVYQEYSGVADTELDASVYTKADNGGVSEVRWAFTDATPDQTQVWDFNAGAWVNQANDVKGLSGDQVEVLSVTGSYVENTETITIPASGKVAMVLMAEGKGVGDDLVAYFDTASFIDDVSTPASSFVGLLVESISDALDIEDTDYFLRIRATGGTPTDLFSILASGEVFVYGDTLDFATNEIDLIVANPTVAGQVANNTWVSANYYDTAKLTAFVSERNPTLVATSSAIDLKSETQTTVYTVPTGYKFIMTGYMWEATNMDSYISDGAFTLGTEAGSYTDVANLLSVPPSNTGEYRVFQGWNTGTNLTTAIAAGGVIKLDVATAGSATTAEAKIHLFGLLIPTT